VDRSNGPIYGIAMDLGTTTVVLRLLNLETGEMAADASFDLLVRKCMKQYTPHFETLHYDVKVDNKTGGEEVTAEPSGEPSR